VNVIGRLKNVSIKVKLAQSRGLAEDKSAWFLFYNK